MTTVKKSQQSSWLNALELSTPVVDERWTMSSTSPDHVCLTQSNNEAGSIVLTDPKKGGWLRDVLLRCDAKTAVIDALRGVPSSERSEMLRLVGSLYGKCLVDARRGLGAASALSARNIVNGQLAAAALRTFSLESAHIAIVGAGRLARAIGKLIDEQRRRRVSYASFVEEEGSVSGMGALTIGATSPGRRSVGKRPDLIICAPDEVNSAMRQQVQTYAWKNSVRCLFAEIANGVLYAGPCLIPSVTGCLSCNEWTSDQHRDDSMAGTEPNATYIALLSAIVAVDVPNIVGEVPRGLFRDQSLLLGQAVRVSLAGFKLEAKASLRHAGCVRCYSEQENAQGGQRVTEARGRGRAGEKS